MLDEQLAKILKLAAMTELDEESVQNAPSRQIIKQALLKRYERDPLFHESLQKLMATV